MKKFAFFLPQFHTIPENDEWWGKGFTEWTNVKKAKPLYRGHQQPKAPLNDNYYNLLERKTVEWQTELMNKYHIDGMVYYHYYFEGRKLLEKPAENLLKWKDIKQPFFFCWANHSWNRAWKGSRELLLEQTYGKEEQWEEHFQYLLPFFKDSRYEKNDGKPILMIYQPCFPEKHHIVNYFKKRCIEEGFNGLFVIESENHIELIEEKHDGQADMILLREPDTARNLLNYEKTFTKYLRAIKNRTRLFAKCMVLQYSGDKLYDIMIKKLPRAKNLCQGVFFEWDNTPRHSNRGYIINPPTKEKFFEYMDSIKEELYLFVNAWNEWAEGMMLEPTEQNGYKYLEWIKEWTESRDKSRR